MTKQTREELRERVKEMRAYAAYWFAIAMFFMIFFGFSYIHYLNLQQENTQLREQQVSYGFSSNGTIWIYEGGWSAYNYADGSWYKDGEKWYSRDSLCDGLCYREKCSQKPDYCCGFIFNYTFTEAQIKGEGC